MPHILNQNWFPYYSSLIKHMFKIEKNLLWVSNIFGESTFYCLLKNTYYLLKVIVYFIFFLDHNNDLFLMEHKEQILNFVLFIRIYLFLSNSCLSGVVGCHHLIIIYILVGQYKCPLYNDYYLLLSIKHLAVCFSRKDYFHNKIFYTSSLI